VASKASVDQVAELVVEHMHDVFAVGTAAVVRFDQLPRYSVLAISPVLPFLGKDLVFKPDERSAAATVARSGKPARVSFDDELLQRLSSFADLVGLAITNAEMLHLLTQQASTDALTERLNLRSFEDHLRREVARADRRRGVRLAASGLPDRPRVPGRRTDA